MVAVCSCARAGDDSSSIDIAMVGTAALLATDDEPIGFALAEARAPLGAHFTASAGLAHLDTSGPREEQQLRLSLSGAMPAANWSLDDRLLWARSDSDVEYWRNRWRMFAPMGDRFGNARWVVFDELYYSDARGGFFRNVIAGGVSIAASPRITTDVMYMYFDNRYSRVSHALLLLASVRFN